ncbi:MAG TPA: MFS transporter [Patescibacteria group bacterium]|nr:MFS transporter [Patescibacteria group bacterium]
MKAVKLFLPKLPDFKDLLSLNKIIYILVFSDFILISSYGLIAPFFAIFLTKNIIGGTLVVVGLSDSIYLATKSLIQIPLGILIDKTKGEKIDFWFLFFGSLLMSLSLFLYVIAKTPLHIYIISLLYGIGSGAAYPAWTGIFTRNMVGDKESFAWSLSATLWQLGSAAAALIGGVLAESLGFANLFIVVGALSLIGTFILFFIYDKLATKQ